MLYSMMIALRSLWQEKWINILSVLTIAMGLLLMSAVMLTIYNLDLFTKKLPKRFSVMAYLKDNLSEHDVKYIADSIRGHSSVEKVRYISKTDALKELKESMKNADYIFEGLEENPLPPSMEIGLKKEAVGPDTVKSFAADIKKMNGIDEVQYGEKFLYSIYSIKSGMHAVGIMLTTIMIVGIIFICYSTVKILFYRKKEEIETLKLLGATRTFIKMPFVIEGGAIGSLGGFVSMLVVVVIYYGILYKLSLDVPILSYIVFPAEMFFTLPVAGLFLGISGAVIAIGRIRY